MEMIVESRRDGYDFFLGLWYEFVVHLFQIVCDRLIEFRGSSKFKIDD